MSTRKPYQPKKLKTLKKRGFMALMSTPGGRNTIKRRKSKGRKFVTLSDKFRIINKKPKSRNK